MKGTNQVFDNTCRKFVILRSPVNFNLNTAKSIENKIAIIQGNTSMIFCYDVDKDELSEESCDFTKNLEFKCVKFPLYYYMFVY